MPTKIASVKNAKPSIANGRPMTSPYAAIQRGHRMPNSNERIVPETAPIANSTASTFDQCRASAV